MEEWLGLGHCLHSCHTGVTHAHWHLGESEWGVRMGESEWGVRMGESEWGVRMGERGCVSKGQGRVW